jgi:Nif-specific regulatory protein
LIEQQGDKFVIADLGSRNGTFVNGIPVKRRELQHGDRVGIGELQFVFLFEDPDEVVRTSEIRMDETEVTSGTTVALTYSEAMGAMARDLTALIKISTTINAIRGLEELQRRLLEIIFEVVPAQHGVIVFTDRGTGVEPEFTSIFGLDRNEGPNKKLTVSGTIVRRALKDNAALLISNTDEDEELRTTSLITARSKCVLCVPLLMLGETLGVIYLDSDQPDVCFNQDQLQLVTAIAAIAAVAIQNARHIETLESENRRLLADANLAHNMVGESSLMQQLYQLVSKVAATESTVLISGESGTGKELAARAIHENSKRANKPFVATNCAALAESLIESELFGHEKGAFTGALNQRKGRLEIADGGTIFLDEIGELSPGLQTKLLRVLQEREFERVGGTRAIKVDIRVIAATNRDLPAAIADGTFRRDLYFRLNVVELKMPPLRERAEDVPLLADYFVARYAEKCNRHVAGISAAARKLLAQYYWPGNVRELENAIERAVVLGTTDQILPEDLPEAILEAGTPEAAAVTSSYHEVVSSTKKQVIIEAIKKANGSYTAAAKILGIHPNYLHRLVTNLNLRDQLKS